MWLNDGIVGLHLYSVHHRVHGLAGVERVTPAVDGLAQRAVNSALPIRGALTLATCNRVELLLDVEETAAPLNWSELDTYVEAELTRHEQGRGGERAGVHATAHHLADAVTHLFDVAAGLDSMVVGEREISGQLRRALTVAGRQGTASSLIHRTVQAALRTSRKVAHLTGLASAGRSVVGVGLNVAQEFVPPLASCRVLLIGTGSYAGASVAGLHERGAMNIAVHSSSGRAQQFAAGHDLTAIAPDALIEELAAADLVVSCRGLGSPVLTVADMRAALALRGDGSRGGGTRDVVLLDLALTRDVEVGVGKLPGVRLIDLHDVRRAVPDVGFDQVARAIDLVRDGTAELARDLDQRRLDPAIVAVRSLISDAVDDEIARLPADGEISRAAAIQSLRRLAARMAHIPTARAHDAAVAGRAEEYVDALNAVLGIDAELGERALASAQGCGRAQLFGGTSQLTASSSQMSAERAAGSNSLEGTSALENASRALDGTSSEFDSSTCPVTGITLTDLGRKESS
ncbi:glutamyl-tRNA reductase [Bowdeniella nasicola]|uniref:Glutamyl-tRNA reductase n=1 Tax=Bowdeniella nasicola TaxID=208480 RepID=A0A1H4BM19_9ACTO|nr:glutamyl-tRNA reductase [Bowdeniella nasicola]